MEKFVIEIRAVYIDFSGKLTPLEAVKTTKTGQKPLKFKHLMRKNTVIIQKYLNETSTPFMDILARK
ncbi:hypothetical protein [Reinekea sp.]|jgi:hypothetical protein|uniref:hypothetical protein n=1 Tax=Reinekea sp. TaxID=1970455 RepID=UPI003988A9CA